MLRIKGGCSYGSIRKILKILIFCYHEKVSGIFRVPSERMMQNWVSKWGYQSLQVPDNEFANKEVCLIIDESISVGNESLLLCLICPFEKEKEGALCYEDVRVLCMKGAVSWKGEDISEYISSVLKEKGYVVKYVVSDEGRNLKKGIRLLEKPHLFDISHAIATCLKKTFLKDENYKSFTKDVRLYQSKLSNGANSHLRPPKQRTKARFMNQANLANWAKRVLLKWNTFNDKIKEIFKNMPTHKVVIEQLSTCIDFAKEVSKPFKISGLSSKTIAQALAIVEKGHDDEKCKLFLSHLKPYLKQYEEFINQEEWEGKSIDICSDIIESIFGCYKSKKSANYFMGVSSITLELPLICLSEEALCQNAEFILEEVKMSDLKEWRALHSADNQNLRRIEFCKN